MCGIFGTVGSSDAYEEIKEGLERLSYRGYDSAGIAILDEDFTIEKTKGHPENLPDGPIGSRVGIGHDRWATHSLPTKENAHPYLSNDNSIALVHNGIIENYSEVQSFLRSNGFCFKTKTDTEVLPNLIQHFLSQDKTMQSAIINMTKAIRGAYAIAFLHKNHPEKIFVVRHGSPICIGRGGSTHYISSDTNSFPKGIEEVITLEDDRFAIITPDSVKLKTFKGGNKKPKWETSISDDEIYNLGKYSTYMEKEISEQPIYLKNAINGRVIQNPPDIRIAGISDYLDKIIEADEVVFVGCGSAFYASQIAARAMEDIGGVRSRALSAGELQYDNPIITQKTVLIAVSQSGETADTIGCIKLYKDRGATTLGIVNVVNSSISRLVDAGIYIRAGQETSVASTKALTNQVFNLLMIAYAVGGKNGLSRSDYLSFILESKEMPKLIKKVNGLTTSYKEIAKEHSGSQSMICIGRGLLETIAYEAALKIKEISYIHAEGYSASELKHGPLVLISPEVPTVAFIQSGLLGHKALSNLHEIASRGGLLIVVGPPGSQPLDIPSLFIEIPEVTNKYLNSMLHLVAAQNIAYFLARKLGRKVDRPRNLSKIISVE